MTHASKLIETFADVPFGQWCRLLGSLDTPVQKSGTNIAAIRRADKLLEPFKVSPAAPVKYLMTDQPVCDMEG